MSELYDNEEFFEAYARMDRSRRGLAGAGEWHQLKRLFPPLKGKSVLDLGCGYGWHCRYAAECGASRILGIDASEKMIETAAARNAAPQITYRTQALGLYEFPENTWDLAVSNLVLHYIEDLNTVYRNVFRTLKPGGIFLFNIEHPVFTCAPSQDWIYDPSGKPLYWPVDGYFTPGVRKTRFLGQPVCKQHHTLTQILGGLLSEGFRITAVEEAQPPAELLGIPGMADELRRPMMLLVRAEKPGGAPD